MNTGIIQPFNKWGYLLAIPTAIPVYNPDTEWGFEHSLPGEAGLENSLQWTVSFTKLWDACLLLNVSKAGSP